MNSLALTKFWFSNKTKKTIVFACRVPIVAQDPLPIVGDHEGLQVFAFLQVLHATIDECLIYDYERFAV
jgi:hypothetical protein